MSITRVLAALELAEQVERRLRVIRAHGRVMWNEQGGDYDRDVELCRAELRFLRETGEER